MPFDAEIVTRIDPPKAGLSGLRLSWEAPDAPPRTYFQVYVAGRLAWCGAGLTCVVPVPKVRSRIDIGAVLPSERQTDFSADLDPAPLDRVTLSWEGGSYLGDGFAGFRVYQGATAGGPIDYTKPVSQIPSAFGQEFDGFGFGPFGGGGFGFAASLYSWTSIPLSTGDWSFGIRSFDEAGNESASAITATVHVTAAPAAPARAADRRRLHYSYDPSTYQVTLTWLASPE